MDTRPPVNLKSEDRRKVVSRRDKPRSLGLGFLEGEEEDGRVKRVRKGKAVEEKRFVLNISQFLVPVLVSVGLTILLVTQFSPSIQRFNALAEQVASIRSTIQLISSTVEARVDSLDYVDSSFLKNEFDALERKVAQLEGELISIK